MHRVLLANPDVKLVEVYQVHLHKHFSVDSAHDGITALRKLKANKPNLIVSDYQLPYLSGIGLLKFVRSNPEYELTPFLFFTRHTNTDLALSFGANDWLNLNQMNPDLLIEKIYYHLSRTSFDRLL